MLPAAGCDFCASCRIPAGYNEKNMHHANLAALLQREPQLVSGVVEAFVYRDPGDVKAARKLTNFPPDKVCHVLLGIGG